MADAAADRLDSWKEIAAYLKRDQRTVRRWERQLGLPVRRVPGGRSIFAYREEIDAWLSAAPVTDEGVVADAGPPVNAPAGAGASQALVSPRRRLVYLLGAAVVAAAAGVGFLSQRARATIDAGTRVRTTPDGIVAVAPDGSVRWQLPFPTDRTWSTLTGEPSAPAIVTGGADPAVFAAVAAGRWTHDLKFASGLVVRADPRGDTVHTFAFQDSVAFRSGTFGPPWILADMAVRNVGGHPWVAVAAHHMTWNASLVTVLDDQWRRRGTFVNNGWVESVQWPAPDRLILGGFSNDRDGAFVALLDPVADAGVAGQGLDPELSPGYCPACGGPAPVRVVLLPRTPLNRATGSPFNRARVELDGDRVVARTIEVPGGAGTTAAEVFYQFLPSLAPVGASFGDRYRELARAAIAQGRLARGLQNSSLTVEVWERSTGWRRVNLPSSPGVPVPH